MESCLNILRIFDVNVLFYFNREMSPKLLAPREKILILNGCLRFSNFTYANLISK